MRKPNAPSNAFGYAQFYSRANGVAIRVYEARDNLVRMREHKAGFKQ